MNIAECIEKCKPASSAGRSREAYTAALIILVAFASFGLGRLSKIEEAREPLRIEYPRLIPPLRRAGGGQAAAAAAAAAAAPAPLYPSKVEQGGRVVASKSGTKYHFPWCGGASQIAEKNKVWFNSVEEARKAGYTPASNCKGLK